MKNKIYSTTGMRILLFFCLLSFSTETVEAQDELVDDARNIAVFQIANRNFKIFPSLSNSDLKPEQMQFRFDPLLIPELGKNGKINIKGPFMYGPKWALEIRILLSTNEAQNRAYASLQEVLPSVAYRIKKSNVLPYGIGKITITSTNLDAISTGSILDQTEFSIPSVPSSIAIRIVSNTKDQSAELKNQFGNLRLHFSILRKQKGILENRCSVKYSDLIKSNLYVKLFGDEKNSSRFVHRDDLRELTRNTSSTMDAKCQIEAPDRFNQSIYEQMLNKFNQKTASDLKNIEFASTYKAEDLEPTIVSKTLNKMFEKEDGTDQWKRTSDVGVKVDGSALFGVISGKTDVNIKLSEESLKKLLQERDITVEFNGKEIIAKSINLVQVNSNVFSDASNFFMINSYLQGSETITPLGDINFGDFTHTDFENDLAQRVADIEERLSKGYMPVGAILAYSGESSHVPNGWMICDGTLLNIDDHKELFQVIRYKWGKDGLQFRIPNLQGLFLRGVGGGTNNPNSSQFANSEGVQGGIGSIQIGSTKNPGLYTDQVGDHNHGGFNFLWQDPYVAPGGNYDDGNFGGIARADASKKKPGVGEGKIAWDTQFAGHHGHQVLGGNDETRPINAGVNYIIKIRP
ncbi:tail fiber protein [Dyadobacter sp. OTU695]|uniref:tail fiber protein n=1 Tax=Dyadobacter sp. OTU695 TaxID=3043860 RepID=UPI00313D52F8